MAGGRTAHHQQKAMSKRANISAAFTAVTIGVLDKLDARLIAATSGVPQADVQRLIDARRAREAGNGLG